LFAQGWEAAPPSVAELELAQRVALQLSLRRRRKRRRQTNPCPVAAEACSVTSLRHEFEGCSLVSWLADSVSAGA